LSAAGNKTKHVHVEPDNPYFAWYIVISVVLVLLGGVFSGLTLGLMGLDTVRFRATTLS
jgi:metal transporter CNNM